MLSAAASGGRAAPSREQLSAALQAANELLEVLNATLDTETAGAGRLSVAARPFDAARLARSTVLLIRPKAAAKGLELVLHIDESVASGPGAAVGDQVRVRQVLSNLMGNAIKYTARGRVEVRVQRAGEAHLRFEIADTGPGLSGEELERAFEPFSRIDRIGLGVSGAGLGLSLSRELARLMGGEVSAESDKPRPAPETPRPMRSMREKGSKARSSSSPARLTCASRSPTPAPASPAKSSSAPSNPSPASTALASGSQAPAWACRSRANWPG